MVTCFRKQSRFKLLGDQVPAVGTLSATPALVSICGSGLVCVLDSVHINYSVCVFMMVKEHVTQCNSEAPWCVFGALRRRERRYFRLWMRKISQWQQTCVEYKTKKHLQIQCFSGMKACRHVTHTPPHSSVLLWLWNVEYGSCSHWKCCQWLSLHLQIYSLFLFSCFFFFFFFSVLPLLNFLSLFSLSEGPPCSSAE